MILPEYIRIALDAQLTKNKLSEVLKARENLTQKYRNNNKSQKIINSEAEIVAYLLSRLPSTYAVSTNILDKYDLEECHSLLDLGSGPGTVIYACNEFLDLDKITVVEQEKSFIDKFKEISKYSDSDVLRSAECYRKDVLDIDEIANHDLVTCSYVLNELNLEKQNILINKIWNKADKFIIIIEPGTPVGYKHIINARTKFIELGGDIVAPCPHNNQCPLEDNDWCHFSQRVERSHYQKFLKTGTESYEDEKFSYIIVAKNKTEREQLARIIRHPMIHKGHIDLKLCTRDGIKEATSSKRDDDYKKIKKSHWGDSIKS